MTCELGIVVVQYPFILCPVYLFLPDRSFDPMCRTAIAFLWTHGNCSSLDTRQLLFFGHTAITLLWTHGNYSSLDKKIQTFLKGLKLN